jgi:hypothetical protein
VAKQLEDTRDVVGRAQESAAALKFRAAVSSEDWAGAATKLNGLNMPEVMRELDRITKPQRESLFNAADRGAEKLNLPRLKYARAVVDRYILPNIIAIPGDLRTTGQVNDAADFLATKFEPIARRVNPQAAPQIARLLLELNNQAVTDANHIAYVLASAHHESGMGAAMTEHDSGQRYEGRADLGNTQAGDGPRYRGRGFVQITGRSNYTRYSRLMNEDMVNHPERAADPDVSARFTVDGMVNGTFTNLTGGIARFNRPEGAYDFVHARQLVNGMDRAEAIAIIAGQYRQVMTP